MKSLKHYYAVVSCYGFISLFSSYGRPELHIFDSKQDRDNFVEANDVLRGNVNNRAWAVTAKEAKEAYGYIDDGIFHIEGIRH